MSASIRCKTDKLRVSLWVVKPDTRTKSLTDTKIRIVDVHRILTRDVHRKVTHRLGRYQPDFASVFRCLNR